MDSRKVLYFLDLLNRETNGHADEIAVLYQKAIDENDDVARLKMLLDECVAYREIGRSLYNKGTELLKNIYVDPTKSLDILPPLRQVCENIEDELKNCDRLMRSPFPFSDAVPLLR